ncbi:piggyBac transposable element-derived protein 4-like [Zophobas morio]|uniref:piggyBac transposable element-derived protein 4-like n=1 Tax=Zophobas morio TaxID=2755281 RepID=UPI003082E2C5
MSLQRFRFLLRSLRFHIRTRSIRKKTDKLAPIRDIFQGFVNKCSEFYQVSEQCTIDEMLEKFRGKCSFRQYIPTKPGKYGIKIYSLADAQNFYTLNMEIYCGKKPENSPYQTENSASSLVQRLIVPISNSGRNVTCDNVFTSISLAKDLLQNHNLTLVGTLRKNKKEIPPVFLATKERPLFSSMFAYGEHSLLLSYVPRKNKNILMLSTAHDTDDINADSGERCLPEVISFYNKHKGGVDVVDKLKSLYSVSRMTQLERNVPAQIKTSIGKQLGITETQVVRTGENVFCSFCPRRKNRKTKSKCDMEQCDTPVCGEHKKLYALDAMTVLMPIQNNLFLQVEKKTIEEGFE